MYCLTTVIGAPPTVEQKYERVHSVRTRVEKPKKLPSQQTRSVSLYLSNSHIDTNFWWSTNKHMNVVGHDLNLRNFEFEFLGHLVSYLNETVPNLVSIENWSPVFRTPDDVVIQR